MSDLPPPPTPPPDLPPPTPPPAAPEPPLPPVVHATSTEPPPPASSEPHVEGSDPHSANTEEATLGLVMYLLPLVGLLSLTGAMALRLPAGAVLAPLILWFIKKDQSTYLDATGKEVLNFNICVLVAFVAVRILYVIFSFIYLGWLFTLVSYAMWLGWVALTVLSAYTANGGKFYRFPLSYPIIK